MNFMCKPVLSLSLSLSLSLKISRPVGPDPTPKANRTGVGFKNPTYSGFGSSAGISQTRSNPTSIYIILNN